MEGLGIDFARMSVMTAFMLFGVLAVFLTKMAELEEGGQAVGPVRYLREHPYRVLNMLVASEILLFVFEEMNQLTVVAAILTGYACQHSSDALRIRAERRLNQPEPPK